ncbi:MAG TPA: cysteine dioxygenase family protein [Pseudonocardiaceae bacterium]|nr:cysteine dioxygenase family protein [Pseudonocardiaceae bacterium]
MTAISTISAATEPAPAAPFATDTAIPADLHPDITDPLLRDLIRPEHTDWSPRELRDLTMTVAAELTTPLLHVLRYTQPRRWWSRLGLTAGVELWLLSWLPGQQTKPHDHGGAIGSFTVLRGRLAEEYRYPGGPVRSQRYTVGDAIGFGAGRAHQLGNHDPAVPAASVHAYSPPLVPTREYQSLLDVT